MAVLTVQKPPTVKPPVSGDSEMIPNDFDLKVEPKGLRDQKVITIVSERLTNAQTAMYARWNDAILNIAYDEDYQWVNLKGGCLSDSRDSSYKELYAQDNCVRPLLQMNIARTMATLPDVGISGLTDSDNDMAGAQEANGIYEHANRVVERSKHREKQSWWAMIGGVGILKQWWDPLLYADFAIATDPVTGTVSKTARMQGGEYAEGVLSIFDVYYDPKARNWHDAGWMAQLSIRSLTWIQQRYPKTGRYVEQGITGYQYQSYEQRISAVSGTFNYQTSYAKNQALVIEMWEKPSMAYPKGRLLTVSNGIVLRNEDWPLKNPSAFEGGEWTPRAEKYPFVPWVYQYSAGAPTGRPLVTSLRYHQFAINKILSNLDMHASEDKITFLRQTGCKIEPGQMMKPQMFQELVTPNVRGVVAFQPPPANDYNFKLLDYHYRKMCDIAGVHDVSQGTLPTQGGDLAAQTVELMHNTDTAKLSIFMNSIEAGEVDRAENILALYRQYGCTLPRITGLDDNGNPQGAKSQMIRFNAFKGGNYRVVVQPGSGMPRLPAAEQEEVDEWMKEGFFGEVGTPGAFKIWAKLSKSIRISRIADEAAAEIAQAAAIQAAQQPNPAQIAQIQNQGKLDLSQQEAQIDEQKQGQVIALQTAADQQQDTAQQNAEVNLEMLKHSNKMAEIAAQAGHDQTTAAIGAHADVQPNVSIAFKAALTPDALQAEQERMGLPGGSAADAKAIQIPPKPVPGLGAKAPK